MPTNDNTRIWNHLQLLLPSPHHAVLTNRTCQEEGPLAVLCGDLHQRFKGTIDNIDLVCASIIVVYATLSTIRVPHTSRTQHTSHLQFPDWPQYCLFNGYLTETAQATWNHLPDNKDMKTAYRNFRAHHPYPVPVTARYTPIGLKHEPVPRLTGQVQRLTLLLAPKRGQTHADHRHPAQSRVTLTKTPHDNPGSTGGPPQLPTNSLHMFGL